MCVRHSAYAIVLVINNNNNVSISNCHILTQATRYRTRHLTLWPFAYLHNSCLAFEHTKNPVVSVWGALTFDLRSDATDTFTSIQQKGVMDPVRIAIYLPLVWGKLTSLARCPALINEAGHKHIAKGRQGFALRTTQWRFLEGVEESLNLETAIKTPHGEVKGWNTHFSLWLNHEVFLYSNMLQARIGIHTVCHSS